MDYQYIGATNEFTHKSALIEDAHAIPVNDWFEL
jgi:hypothetical protein